MRVFKITAKVRKFTITASPRKLFGRVTAEVVIDPEPLQGAAIWGNTVQVIDQTPGSFEDYD